MKFFLVLVATICIFGSSYAQTPIVFDLKKTIPTSPEAALLGRFGEIPVGYYTGTADISIPIYTIKEGGVEIPITLNYHSSGIKVEDEATWAGLGWSLEPGGAVIKTVEGLADGSVSLRDRDPAGYDYLFGRSITGVYSQTGSVGNFDFGCFPGPDGAYYPPTPANDSKPIFEAMKLGEGQPDIYQFNFPGGFSGKFYINPQTGAAVQIDKKAELNIQLVNGEWVITTLDGNKYHFGANELSYPNGFQGQDYGATSKLSKIELSNGKTITFTYGDGYFQGNSYNETYHDPYSFSTQPSGDAGVVSTWSYTLNHTKYLKQITGTNIIIKFNVEDRADLQGQSDNDGDDSNGTQSVKRVKSIDIIDAVSNKIIKSYNFSYSYFQSSTIGTNYKAPFVNPQTETDFLSKRLRLDSVKEVGYTATNQPVSNPAYKFNYNTTLLPYKTSFARDFWGYYNGKDNTRLLPDLNFFYYSGFPEYQNIPASTLGAYTGADRTADTTKMTAALLQSITYPTGGYTNFEYQANSFSNYNYPDGSKISNSQRNVNIADYNNAGNTTVATFTLPQTETIKFTNTINKGPSQTLTFSDMLPSTITLKKTVGGVVTILKTWQMQNNSADQQQFYTGAYQWVEDYTFTYDANATYSVEVSLPDNLGPQNSSTNSASVISQFTYYSTPVAGYMVSSGGGVRVKSITNFDSGGTFSSKKLIKYTNTDNSSSGKLMSPLKFLYSRVLLTTQYVGNTWTSSTDHIYFISSQSVVPYSDGAGGNPVGYSRVEEWNVDLNGNINGKHIYYYNNKETNTKINNPNDPDLMNGMVAKEVMLKTNGDTVSSTVYHYTDHFPSPVSITGVKLFSNFNGADPCYIGQYSNIDSGFDVTTKWEVDFYPINSKWYLQDYKITNMYFGSNHVTETASYIYNPIGQLTRQTTVNSKKETLITNYVYPYDITPLTGISKSLVDSSFYNSLLGKYELNNGTEMSQVKVSYAINNNQLVETEIDHSYKGGSLLPDATFDHYGPNKTLTQASEKGILPSSFIYDDNNLYRIAYAKNATVADIAYTSFEPGQAGNWIIGSSSRNFTAMSGKQSYELSSGSLSKSGLNASKTYIVSYWTTNSSPFTIAGTITGFPVRGATINGWTNYTYQVIGQTSVIISGTGGIDEVRLFPLGAQMSTYTYAPLIGMTSLTDAKGETTYYEYDAFQRLMNVKDKDGNIIRHTDYHYQGQ